MLPYYKNGNELEKLLGTLFEDNEEGITILNIGIPLPQIFTSCCTYSYGGMG